MEAWNTIPTEMVMKSFFKCGISNSLNGSEDDALFDEYVLSTDSPCNETQDDSVTDNSDNSYVYDGNLTNQQASELFMSHKDSFDGF